MSKSIERAREDKIHEVLQAFAEGYSKQYGVFDPGPYLDYVPPYAMEFTFEDGKYVEGVAVTIRIELPGEKFPTQVLSVQVGITLDDCNRLETYGSCHMGTCTYFHLEPDAILWIIPFCISLDNGLDTGQDNLGCVSIANEPLYITSDASEIFEGVLQEVEV